MGIKFFDTWEKFFADMTDVQDVRIDTGGLTIVMKDGTMWGYAEFLYNSEIRRRVISLIVGHGRSPFITWKHDSRPGKRKRNSGGIILM